MQASHRSSRPARGRLAARPRRRLAVARGAALDRRALGGALALVLLLLAGPGRAQVPGILLGRAVVVHPAVTTELRLDTNLFSINQRAEAGLPRVAAVLRVIPAVSVASLNRRGGGQGAQRLSFRLQGSLDYREFLSPDPTINVHRSFGGELSAQLSLRPQGVLGLDVYDNFIRSNQVPYSVLPYNFARNTNVFGLRVRFSPLGQRLALTAIQEIGFDGFDDVAGGPRLSDFNILYANLSLRGAWKFLPKTALFLELTQGVSHYLSASARAQHRSDSFPLRLGLGVVGLISPKVALNAFAGYGHGLYLSGPSPSTAVVQAEARFKPTFFSTATVGYRHDFNNALIGSYLDVDSASATYSHSLHRLTLLGRVAVDRLAYRGAREALVAAGVCEDGETMPCIPQTDRVDHVVSLDARLEYPLKDWLVAGLGYGFSTNQSNGYTRIREALTPVTYLKHEAWLRLTVRY